MSLHIGNLSSRTYRGELERVFQRFGRCNVRMKDGYGFVVYDSPSNAEKALVALRGRNICGEPLTLSWSNKQPRHHERFSKATRSSGPLNRRSFASREGEYLNRKLHSNGIQHYKYAVDQVGRNGRRGGSPNLPDEDTRYHQASIEGHMQEEHFDFRGNFPDELGNLGPNLVDNDRWNGQLHDQPNGNAVETGMESDQYERYRGYDKKGEGENSKMAYSDGFHALQRSQEMMEREHLSEAPFDYPNDSRLHRTCYGCGESGHKMHNCPRESNSQRKLMKFGNRHDDDISRRGGGEDKLERDHSRGKLRLYRGSVSMSELRDDGKAFGSVRHPRLVKDRCSNEAKETDGFRRKDQLGKKRGRRNFGTLINHSEKKAKRSDSFPLHSDYTKSRSQSSSRSSKSVLRSALHSKSRSVSSRSRSLSCNIRSSSTSHDSRSTHSKSSSRSRLGSHTSLSLSVSLRQPLPSSPDKMQLNLKGSLSNADIPESKEMLVEQGQAVGAAEFEITKLDNNMLMEENENVVSSPKLENGMDKNQPIRRDGDDNLLMCTPLQGIANPSTSPPEKGMRTVRSMSSEILNEIKDCQNFDTSMMMHMPPPVNNSHSEAPISSHSAFSMSISSEEMYMILKHCDLKLHDETERSSTPETYFGSARLWPWEIIYYRRLKKGPISIENYARRVEQNQEFHIVDKFVRSSSGWGELGQDYHEISYP